MKISAQWLAGFIDGEGCLSIHTRMRTGKSKARAVIQGRLSIANTHLPTLLAIKAEWGGKLSYKKYTSPSHQGYKGMNKTKQGYELLWYNQADLMRVLEAIHPYIIVKKDQFDLFMAYYKPTIQGPEGAYHLSEAEYEQRLLVKSGLQDLKKKNY